LAQTNAPKLKINYGMPTADYFTVYVAKDLGLFDKVGLEPNFYFFQSGAPLLAALKSESLDVITTGLATVFALGQNIPLKFLYWELNHALAEGLVVDPKSGITNYTELAKAKAVGAPSGTCAQVSLSLIEKKIGAQGKINVINIAPPLYANALSSGSIQAGIAWSPYSLALQQAGYKVVNWDPDYAPDNGVCPGLTALRSGFLAQHPEVGLRLVRAHALAREAIDKNPQLAIDALVKYLSISPAVAKASYERECCERLPSFEQQLEPNSPYSLTSQDGGLGKKLLIASQELASTKTIPAPLTQDAIRKAIEPSYIRQFLDERGK
jgi:NitT/TauT family transport system substrate-binding protein